MSTKYPSPYQPATNSAAPLSAIDERAHSKVAPPLQQAISKVPEVTIFFWIIKLLTTGMGEITSDWAVFHLVSPQFAVALVGICTIAAFILQLSVRRYVPWIYWLNASMIATFGTMVSDVPHVLLGISYTVLVVFFAVLLAIIFVLWYRSEKTLSIHSITTRRRELFYWAVVIATFALGTALGDFTAATLHMGYFASIVLFAIVFAIPGLSYWRFGMNSIFAFWFAYIITRPLGASVADWMGKSQSVGGIGLGSGQISLTLALVLCCFVAYVTVTRKDMPKEQQ